MGTREQMRKTTKDVGMKLVECFRAREVHGSRLKELKIEDAHSLSLEAATLLEECADQFLLHRFRPPTPEPRIVHNIDIANLAY